MASQLTPNETGYELRFESLTNAGRGYSFPCDASGKVDMDALSERGRNSYLGARALVGRDFAFPVVKVAVH
jgi:hypothetical protein